MKLLLVSASYITNTIAKNIRYLIGRGIKELLCLEEYHSLDDLANEECNDIKRVLYRKYEDAVVNCDVVIIVNDGMYSDKTIDNAVSIAHFYEKKIHVVEFYNEIEVANQNIIDTSLSMTYPFVLILSLGEYCQEFCTEIIVNEAFNKRGIKIKQEFSSFTHKLLSAFQKIGLINNALYDSINTNEFNIAIKYINCNKMMKAPDDYDLLHMFSSLRADYVILVTEAQTDNYEEIINLLRYRYSCRVNNVVPSRYIHVKRESGLSPLLVKDTTNANLDGSKLISDILGLISMPSGVRLL